MSPSPEQGKPGQAVVAANVGVLVQPDDGVEPVLRLIQSATRRLLVKQYTLTHPALTDALIAAAGRGVAVRVLLNPQRPDASRTNDVMFGRLEQAGIEAAWANPAFSVTHEKSVVVDDSVCLIATFNMAEKYFTQTRDYGLLIHRASEIADVAACFAADWQRSTFHPAAGTALIWSNANARLGICAFIDAARHRLDIQHPKFVDMPVLDRIVQASARGVRVRLLCGGRHGMRAWDLLDTMAALRVMALQGVRIRKQKNLRLHAKMLIADDTRAQVGSMNIHHVAYDTRRELGAVIADPVAVVRLRAVFEADWEASHHFEPPDPLEPIVHADDDFPADPDLMHD